MMSYLDDKNIAYLVLAYPKLKDSDRKWIDDFRKKNSILYGVVDPHFTIVFPTHGISYDEFENHVINTTNNIKAFDFKIRCAILNNDSLSEFYHFFLVPDEGNSNIIKLHDLLYTGILRESLLLDIDFVSHIAIGSNKDSQKAKELVDELNSQNFEIEGKIDTLDIISYSDKKVTKLKTIKLID